jgi:hypothetical protein
VSTSPKPKWIRGCLALLAGGGLLGGVWLGWTVWRTTRAPVGVVDTVLSRDAPRPSLTDPAVATWPPVEKFCSTCHTLPPADVEPRHLWPKKIQEMYDYAQSGGPWPKTQIPPIEEPIAYFTARAPEQLPLPPDVSGSPPSPLPLVKHEIRLPELPSPPSISCVKFVRLAENRPAQLLISEMRHGLVALWTPTQPNEPAQILARVAHPSHTTVVDLDRDGSLDILVADLGDFWPVDTDKGRVMWLRGQPDGTYQSYPLLDGVGRVNDVQAADFDGDGDLDLIVAVFGNFHTGMIVYLENFTQEWSQPDFEPTVVDGHTGTSDVPVVDLNGDGRPDFIALQSQQHERIVAFLNVGRGRFEERLIYAAPHPRWGSTGIKLLDVDHDGDIDVLFNHGDSVQVPPVPRPYHGVSWLENRGTFPFVDHRITHLPGAHTCQPADLDGDGDEDLVSGVFIPVFNPAWPDAHWLESLVWLEQTRPGEYRRYVIETGYPFHPCADACDYDGDGDVDVAVGNFVLFPGERRESMPNLLLLENRRAQLRR